MSGCLKLDDFVLLFGTSVDDISEDCRELIAKRDWRYKILAGDERDRVLLNILKKIDSGQLSVAGRKKKPLWEKGWSENFQNFLEKKCDCNELTPKYYHFGQALRIYKSYAIPNDPNFEINFFEVFRLWLFRKYLRDAESVYEFGCGPGHNLVVLAQLYPEKKIHGLDWVNSSRKLVDKIAEVYKYNLKGHLFDMFSPDYSIEIADKSIIMTFGALEQLGNDYERFLQFLVKKAPMLCLHAEPFCELYDENNLLDYLAVRHHKSRNLLGNYIASLKELEAKGKIEIIKIHRMPFGSILQDGWSLVVWRPKG